MSTTPVADKPKNRFIDPKVLMRIQNLELVARTVVEGFVQGLHKSPYLGFSVDFAEYRQYMPGDDIRRIDWKVYGRSDKLFIKLYEGETNTRVLVLLDVSGSMNYGSKEIKKIDYARILAACLSYFAYHQRDGVGLLTFDTEVRAHIPASRRSGQLFNILKEIDNVEPAKETEFRKPLRYLAEILNRRGLIIVISDFYDDPANIVSGLKALKTKGNDIMAFHIMDDYELTFPFEEMAQFEDLETKKKLHIIPEYLKAQYLTILNDHMKKLKQDLKAAQIDYTMMNTSQPLDAALFAYLAARSNSDEVLAIGVLVSLLNPFFLIGSIILAVPVLIHLVRRERSEIIPFSSLMFLLKVPKRSIRQQKLKNLLLMILRLLILALLVGVFTRPYFAQSAAPIVSTGQNRGVVVLLDNSYSVRYGNNFDRMKSEANSRIDALGSGDEMALIAFNDSANVLSMPTSDKAKLKAAVSALEPSYGGTRFYEAFTVADRLLAQLGEREKQLIMISDFQRVGWNRSSRENVIGKDVKTEMVNVGVEKSTNLGIDSVSANTTTFTRTYADRVIARVHNYNKDQPASVPVSLSINDKEVLRRNITVSANSTALAEFTGFDLNLGLNRGRVRLETNSDPLPVDNDFLFSVDRREKLNILIVDAGRARQSFFLRQAFTSAAELPYEVTVVPGSGLTVDELNKHAVVIFNDVPRLSNTVTERMDELRKTSQSQFVILADNADLDWWGNYAKLPVKPTRRIFVQKDRGQPSMSITTFDRNHSIFKPFETSAKFTINTAQFFAIVQTEPKPNAVVLAKFEDGSPALVESGPDDHGLIVFTSSVNGLPWNDLPVKPSFAPFFHEIVHYLSRYNESRGWYALGDGVPVVGSAETAAAAVIGPDGERQSLGELGPGQQRFFTPQTPGFYETRIGKESHLIAVNPPASEGNLDAMPPDDLLASVQRLEGDTSQADGLFGGDAADDYARRQKAWWYLLIIALLAVIGEIYLANRSPRGQQVAARKA